MIMLNILGCAQQSECDRLVKTLTRFNSFFEAMQWSDECRTISLYQLQQIFLRSHPILTLQQFVPSYILQIIWQLILGMFVFKVLLISLRIWHLSLQKDSCQIYVWASKNLQTTKILTLHTLHTWTSAFCAAFFWSLALCPCCFFSFALFSAALAWDCIFCCPRAILKKKSSQISGNNIAQWWQHNLFFFRVH